MGGSSCLTFTALHPDLIDGVASMNGTANHLEYANFQDAISASFGGTKEQIPEQYKQRSAEYWPERFTMPVGITASGQDKSVPPASVLRLANVLSKMGRKVLLIYREDVGHTTRYDDGKAILEYVIREAKPLTHTCRTHGRTPARPVLVRVALNCSVCGGVFLRFRKRKTRYDYAECALHPDLHLQKLLGVRLPPLCHLP